MMTITKLLFTGAISTLLSINATAQRKDTYAHKIDSIITASSPIQFNGVVLVTQKGNIQYLKSNGYKDFEKKIPLKTDDQFEIMSNSKQVTAVWFYRLPNRKTGSSYSYQKISSHSYTNLGRYSNNPSSPEPYSRNYQTGKTLSFQSRFTV